MQHSENLAQFTRSFQTRDPQRVPCINLFPNYSGSDQLGTVEYKHHVRAFLETILPPILSCEHCTLMEWRDRPEYFANLEIIRRQSGKMSRQRTGGSP